MTAPVSERRRRRQVLDALRRGTVPQQGLDLLAVGLGRFTETVDRELGAVSGGESVFKAVRGDYGAGGLAVAEVQVSETETPLHKLETVYRRLAESLATAEYAPRAFRAVLDAWLFTLEEDVLAGGQAAGSDAASLGAAV